MGLTERLDAATRLLNDRMRLSPPRDGRTQGHRLGVDLPLLIIAIAFFLLGLVRLGFPPEYYFDEGFYVPTSVRLANLHSAINREHPMLAKELLAAWMHAAGVGSASWRFPSLVFGTISIYAAGAAMKDPRAGRILAILLALAFPLFVLCRAGLLETTYFMFCALGVWMFRYRKYAAAGAMFGLAVAAKWSAAPLLLFLCIYYTFFTRENLVRGAITLGLIPVGIYFLSYLPAFFVEDHRMSLGDLVPLQHAIMDRHAFYDPVHPEDSEAWQWVINVTDQWLRLGEQGILLTGNPFIMLPLIPAVLWGLWKKWPEAYFFVGLIAFWMLASKTNQFYYHYLLPSAFGMSALARVLTGSKKLTLAVVLPSAAFFAFMYPAMVGMPLDVHVRMYPQGPAFNPRLTASERLEFEQLEYCMYHPTECYYPWGGKRSSISYWHISGHRLPDRLVENE